MERATIQQKNSRKKSIWNRGDKGIEIQQKYGLRRRGQRIQEERRLYHTTAKKGKNDIRGQGGGTCTFKRKGGSPMKAGGVKGNYDAKEGKVGDVSETGRTLFDAHGREGGLE